MDKAGKETLSDLFFQYKCWSLNKIANERHWAPLRILDSSYSWCEFLAGQGKHKLKEAGQGACWVILLLEYDSFLPGECFKTLC